MCLHGPGHSGGVVLRLSLSLSTLMPRGHVLLIDSALYLAFINHGSEMIMQVKNAESFFFFLTCPRTLTQAYK